MKVTFISFGKGLASSRLRAEIPQAEFAKMGIERGSDVVVYGKHWVYEDQLKGFKKKVFDVCDNHFHNEHADYYKRHCQIADLITCNSENMASTILVETGRKAVVIPEPYESDEGKPEIGPRLLWFGHASNLIDLARIRPKLRLPLLCMTNHEEHTQWTPENFKKAISAPCVVVIPTGRSYAKSENRMVESIRNGRYVCAEYLPSYEKFSEFFALGDIPSHVEAALSNPKQAIDKIRAAQDFIRNRYSPKTIANHWLEAINGTFHL